MSGGTGYIDFQDYYHSSILSQLKEWFYHTPTTQWGLIEASYCTYGSTNLWLFGSLLGVKTPIHLPPTMLASIRIWQKFISSTGLAGPGVEVRIPIQTLYFVTNRMPISFWNQKGIRYLDDFYSNGYIKTFSSIQSEYDLPHTNEFQYTQLMHCLYKLGNISKQVNASAWTYFSSPIRQNKGISLFYQLMQQKRVFNKSASHLLWEKDLKCSFTNDQWRLACKANQSATRCTSLWELSIKITLRWYLTPVIVSKFDPQTPAACWRRCPTSVRGDIFHILWSCPKLTVYWAGIFNIISDLTQTRVAPDPALAILSLGIDRFSFNLRRTITHLLLAARLSITRKWKDPDPPSPDDAIDLLDLHNSYERILASSLGSLHKYSIQWDLWNVWFKNRT